MLRSLWEAVAGDTDVSWAVRDEDGVFVAFTPAMEKVWAWKDELPRRRLACIGLHVVRTTGLVAPRLVPALYALTGRSGALEDFRDEELEPLQREVAEAALELGRPTSRRELRLLVGREKRHVDAAVNVLQRKLILTNAGRDDTGSGWASTLHDLFARRWRARLRRIPPREKALRALTEPVVRAAGDVSVADLAAALRLRRREASTVLEELEAAGALERRDEDGVAVWVARRET
ncbi:MAG: crosslink repair DNA glycosylase YcaQ family protein [Gaiellaceae bacterium]